jgi:predicted DNA-binding transcriptional regulator YafY
VSSTETVCRQLDILQLIPRLPRMITAREIFDRLPDNDYTVSLRTVQRDLDALSCKFPISCDTQGRAQHWYWAKGAEQITLPHMSASMAATLQLARDYLRPVLPAGVLNELKPLFDHAAEVLDQTALKGWHKKVRIIDRGLTLIPPQVSAGVQDVVYQALLDNRQIAASYKARGRDAYKDYTLNPLGLVVKGGVFYLVVTFAGYTDLRQLALHRMNRAELLTSAVARPKGFSLQAYIEDDAGFSYPLSPDKIKLELVFQPGVAHHLTESKLSPDQTTDELPDGCLRLKATVADSDELRWWLKAFGDDVQVVKPASLGSDLHLYLRRKLR